MGQKCTAEFWKQRNQVVHTECKSALYPLYLAHIPRHFRKVRKQTIMSDPQGYLRASTD